LAFSGERFVALAPTKQFPGRRNHFSLFAQNSGNARWLSNHQQNGGGADRTSGDSHMRTISFILAFAFVMAGSSMAGSQETGLPGIGTFSYNGSPIVSSAPMVLAAAN